MIDRQTVYVTIFISFLRQGSMSNFLKELRKCNEIQLFFFTQVLTPRCPEIPCGSDWPRHVLLPPKCQDYSHALPHLAYIHLFSTKIFRKKNIDIDKMGNFTKINVVKLKLIQLVTSLDFFFFLIAIF